MKIRTAFVSSALFLAVLGWACERNSPTSPTASLTPAGALATSATSPTASLTPAGALATSARSQAKGGTPGPPPNGGGTEEATFSVTLSGNVSGGPQQFTDFVGPTRTSLHVSITLDLGFFQKKVADGTTCFDASESGRLVLGQDAEDPSSATVRFSFDANGTDGTTLVQYLLLLSGVIDVPGNWPPAVGDPNTISGGEFELRAYRGPGKKVACRGVGPVVYEILVERLS